MYYGEQKVTNPIEAQAEYDNTRLALIDQMEKVIERQALFIADKQKKWEPFEYSKALETLHKMQMNLLEAQNWNMGRQNDVAINSGIRNNISIFNELVMDVGGTEKTVISEFG